MPSNDLFSARTRLSGYTGFGTAWSRGATAQSGERNHAGQPASASVWWSWQAPGTGPVRWGFDYAPEDSVFAVYTGNSLGSLTVVPIINGSRFNATAGVDYKIVVNSPDAEALVADRPIELHWDLNSLTLTSPSNQAVFAEGQPIRLTISTTEKAGDIQAVDYRSGDDVITSISAAPYAYTWTNARAGAHELSVRASTRLGFAVTSAPKFVLVRAGNDLFTNRRFVEGADVSLKGWLGGAGREPGEPDHAAHRPRSPSGGRGPHPGVGARRSNV
jgi:hypothetical protein